MYRPTRWPRMFAFVALVIMLSTRPINAQGPMQEAKQRILDLLSQRAAEPQTGVLSGQNMGHSNFEIIDDYERNVLRLVRHTGRWPAILAADYGYDNLDSDFTVTNQLLNRHYRRAGLVSISMHPANPWRNSDCHDLNVADLRQLTQPGSEVHDSWRNTLDQVADGLSELQQLGVVVLWRPFHEMNGGWFWWGANGEQGWTSRDEFVALWMDMHDYFTKVKKLDNLLWVYSAAVKKGDGEKSVLHYYPGDEYVDVVGLDWYADQLQQLDEFRSYSELAALDKPFGLTEFGPLEKRDGSFDNRALVNAVIQRYPKLSFFVQWHSWPGARVAIVDQYASRAMMSNPRVISIKENGK